MASIRLGDLLVKAKVISETQLRAALAEQQKWGGRLGEILVRMSILTEDMLVKALSKQLNVPAVNLETISNVPAHVRAKVPADVARDLTVLPLQLRDEGRTLIVAMAEPQNIKHLDTIRSVSRCARVTPQLAGRQAIARAFSRLYEGEAEVGDGSDGSFKMVDAQGHTIIRSTEEIAARKKARDRNAEPPPSADPPMRRATGSDMPAPAPQMRTASLQDVPSSAVATAGGKTPAEILRGIEDAQRKEVTALKAMVELLIDKGIFTRDEYLARVKR